MKSKFLLVIFMIAVAAMVLAACGRSKEETLSVSGDSYAEYVGAQQVCL